MKARPQCNRVMGCPGLVTLSNYGRAAVPLAVEAVEAEPRADGYWLLQLVRLLGQLDDDRALPLLHRLSVTPGRWEVRIRATQALAHLARPASLAVLEDTLSRASEGGNIALEAAARFALSRVAPSRAAAERAALVDLVPRDRQGLAATPPIILDILIEIVREARLPRALHGVRLASRSDNRFVRKQALKTLAALQDTGGIPYALERVEDPIPSIRRQALTTLQTITGMRTMTRPRQWRQWCERNGLATVPE